MENLAGDKDCDIEIKRELTRCGIDIVRNQPREGEVPSSLRGKLGSFIFFRAWYYWVVDGDVPFHVAWELYSDPVGKTDIRVCGDCGCPPPRKSLITWRDRENRKLVPMSEREKLVNDFGEAHPIVKNILNDPTLCFVPNPATEGKGFITSYHIDSEVGLRLFADTLKRHRLV